MTTGTELLKTCLTALEHDAKSVDSTVEAVRESLAAARQGVRHFEGRLAEAKKEARAYRDAVGDLRELIKVREEPVLDQ